MSQDQNHSLLARCLERIESNWHQIDGEWGPVAGGLEGEIERGEETLIPELRAALAGNTSPPLPTCTCAQNVTLPGQGPTFERLYTAGQMREYAELVVLGSWQQGWNECSDLRETQIAEAEVDALKYRALLASATGKPENLRRLLSDEAAEHYVAQQYIEAAEPSPGVQIAAHVMVSERHGKFDLIHLVAYLLDRSPWLPIDSAPKDGTVVRLFGKYADATTAIEHLGWWSADYGWIEQANRLGPLLFEVTHWAPRGPIPLGVKP